jgi:hypothetical protein
MLISEAVELTKILYSRFNAGNFDKIVGKNLFQAWKNYDGNILAFIERLPPENRDNMWNWLKRLGVNDLDHLRRLYSFNTLIFSKMEQAPEDLKNFYLKYGNVPLFIGDLSEGELPKLIEWLATCVTENELNLANRVYSIKFSKNISVFSAKSKPNKQSTGRHVPPARRTNLVPVRQREPAQKTAHSTIQKKSVNRFQGSSVGLPNKPKQPKQPGVGIPHTIVRVAEMKVRGGETNKPIGGDGVRTLQQLRQAFGGK